MMFNRAFVNRFARQTGGDYETIEVFARKIYRKKQRENKKFFDTKTDKSVRIERAIRRGTK